MTRKILMCMKERQSFVDYLTQKIPDLELCYDQVRSARDTFERALSLAGNDQVVIMEDDIILTKDFQKKLELEISKRPWEVINFFSQRPTDLIKGSRHDSRFSFNQCFYLPKGMAKGMLEFSSNWWGYTTGEHPTGYDMMMDDYLRENKKQHWIVVPSLVNHRSAKSMIDPRRSTKRQSKTFNEEWE